MKQFLLLLILVFIGCPTYGQVFTTLPTMLGAHNAGVSDAFSCAGTELTCDTFEGKSDGVALNTTSPDVGADWAGEVAWEIDTDLDADGRAFTLANRKYTWSDAGQADVTIEAVVRSVTGGKSGLAFRVTDSDNLWYTHFHENNDELQLVTREVGSETTHATANITVTPDTDYDVRVVLSGNDIEIFVDDVSQITHTSTTFNTNTQHGVATGGGNSGAYVDDYKVTQ